MFEFNWPLIFVLLPAPIIIRRFVKPAAEKRQAVIAPFFTRIQQLNEDASFFSRADKHLLSLIRMGLLWCIWILLVTAAARPGWMEESVQISTSGRDLILAVDLSGSMEVEDMFIDQHPATRLLATKEVIYNFLSHRKGDRLGLIFFGTKAYLQTPLTFDLKTIQTFINEAQIGMAGKYTAIGDAIGLGIQQLRNKPENQRVMILLTDGANTTGAVQPQQAADLAGKLNIKIYTIGIGAEEIIQPTLFGNRKINPSADLDEALLSHIAEVTGGQYFRARNVNELKEIYKTIDKIEAIELDPEHFRIFHHLYYWPLGLSFILSLLLSTTFIDQFKFLRLSNFFSNKNKLNFIKLNQSNSVEH